MLIVCWYDDETLKTGFGLHVQQSLNGKIKGNIGFRYKNSSDFSRLGSEP